jgi:hypothetical protein
MAAPLTRDDRLQTITIGGRQNPADGRDPKPHRDSKQATGRRRLDAGGVVHHPVAQHPFG